jgi:hypothetical protein
MKYIGKRESAAMASVRIADIAPAFGEASSSSAPPGTVPQPETAML